MPMCQLKRRKNRFSLRTGIIIVSFAIMAMVSCEVCLSAEPAAYQYEALGRRDPFVPLVGVVSKRSGARGLEGILTVDDVSLQGILVGANGKRIVIINGEMVNEGAKIGTMTIESIGKNEVVVKIEEEFHTIKLYEQ